jgi:pimeloyl-ACP methyl ester carboxylesterase
MTTTTTVTSADGTTIAFDRVGTGPALILVGGAFQHRAFDPRTAEMAQLLAKEFTVYHYDRRGRGGSSDELRFTSGTAETAIQREIEDITALVADAGGGPVFLYGMSSGGVLALEAIAAGLPVAKVALYEVPLVVGDNRPTIPAGYRAELGRLIDAGQRGDAVELFLTQAVGVPAAVVEQMRQSPVWPGFEAVAPTLPYDSALVESVTAGTLPRDRWATVKIPALVADGAEGMPWMRPAADTLADLLPDARRTTLPGQDHGVAPEAIAPVIRDFYLGS